MTPSEYQHLIDFLSKKFDGMDERFVKLEVGHEELRSNLKAVAEGVTMNGQRIDRVLGRLDGMDDTLRDLAKAAAPPD